MHFGVVLDTLQLPVMYKNLNMSILRPILSVLFCTTFAISLFAKDIYDEFSVQFDNAQLSQFAGGSLEFESHSHEFSVKLEPNLDGQVMFSIGRHRFRSTIVPKDLYFGVRISGYYAGKVVNPSYTIDDSYRNVFVDSNMIIFQTIDFPLPVLFDSGVDSIILHFSNSHGFNFHQYYTIDELQVLETSTPSLDNPLVLDCEKQSIMIAIQGSNGIDKNERKTISKELSGLFKSSHDPADSNEVSILQFGKDIQQYVSTQDKKEILGTIKNYKKSSKTTLAKSKNTNWEAALDEALKHKPDIFILVTNSWSNYNSSGRATINAQHASLIKKCNAIKANGTRLLFITSGLYDENRSNSTLLGMLNASDTKSVTEDLIHQYVDLRSVDLVSMRGFEDFRLLDLSSLIQCQTQEELVGLK